MNVQFSEAVVIANPNKKQIFMRDFFGALLASAILLSVFIDVLFLFLTPVFGFLLYRSLVATTAEYEYIHTNGDFDVDRIVFNSKRKRMVSIRAGDIVCVVPDSAPRVSDYRYSSVKDYSANADGKNRYAMVYKTDGKMHKLILHLDEKMLNSLKSWMPTKVELCR